MSWRVGSVMANGGGLRTQGQPPGARDAPTVTRTARRRSLQRLGRPNLKHLMPVCLLFLVIEYMPNICVGGINALKPIPCESLVRVIGVRRKNHDLAGTKPVIEKRIVTPNPVSLTRFKWRCCLRHGVRRLTIQVQRPGARDAMIATTTFPLG